MLIRDPVLQELKRRMAAEHGATVTPVVEHFDLIKQIGNGLVSRRVVRAVHPFRQLLELRRVFRLRYPEHIFSFQSVGIL